MSLLEMSLAGGLIVLAGAVIRLLGRDRLPARTFEALWTLAVLRLTLPVRLPFRLSAWTLLRRAVPQAAGSPASPAAVALPGQAAEDAVDIIQKVPLPDAGAPFPTAAVLYGAGAALGALVFAAVYIRCRRRFRDSLPADSGPLASWLDTHPLRRRVQIRVSDRIAAPLTYGTLRPVILLPKGLDREGGPALEFVLEHELAHIRRFDGARKLILAGVLCLHWFNPLVWALFALANRDMERACDEAVIRAMGPDVRRDYARALLAFEERRTGAEAAAFAGAPLEERIRYIMKIRPRSFLSIALALLLVLGVGGLFATSASAAPEEPQVYTLTTSAVPGGEGQKIYTVFSSPSDADEQEQVTVRGDMPIITDIEWWTAEEYAQWLEQEKKDLQACLGQRAWTSSDGWFTWTQEKIDETIEMYEHILEEIEDGLRLSKSVNGGDTAIQVTTTAKYDASSDDVDSQRFDQLAERCALLSQQLDDLQGAGEQAEREALQEQLDATREQLEQEMAQIERQLAAVREAEEETVLSGQADGVPYESIESGCGFHVNGDMYVPEGGTAALELTARTDASLTVSLFGDVHMGQSVDLKAGETRTVTFTPEQAGRYHFHLTNNSEYPVEFIASWVVN